MERLQRILAARGVSSRRNAEELIRAGRVTVDGDVVTELGSKADPIRAVIRVDGKLLKPQRARYILLNKPRGYITTVSDERDRSTVMDLVEIPERVYPVGRLDRDTEGLLLLTNDGDVANRVMHPRYKLTKEYHVLTLSRPTDAVLQRIRDGLTIEGKRIVPEEVRIVRESSEGLILKIVVHEGINHLVRRMMDAVGIPIERLRRMRVGPLTVTGIQPGTWREMTHGEVRGLLEALHLDLAEKGEEIERLARSVPVKIERPARPAPRPRAQQPDPLAELDTPRPRGPRPERTPNRAFTDDRRRDSRTSPRQAGDERPVRAPRFERPDDRGRRHAPPAATASDEPRRAAREERGPTGRRDRDHRRERDDRRENPQAPRARRDGGDRPPARGRPDERFARAERPPRPRDEEQRPPRAFDRGPRGSAPRERQDANDRPPRSRDDNQRTERPFERAPRGSAPRRGGFRDQSATEHRPRGRYQTDEPQERRAQDDDTRQPGDRDRRTSGGGQEHGGPKARKPRRRDLP
jgi:23S rRNA pseudouridine2605 synthase